MKDVHRSLKKISETKRHLEKEAHTRVKGLVSICIPNYNKAPYLKDCIESINDQNYRLLEVIIVDDHSSDNSDEVIKELKKTCAVPIHYMRLPKRMGTAWAQNFAYYLSSGEYVANLDSDDSMCFSRIKKQVQFLEENNLDIVGTNFSIFEKYPKMPTIRSGGHWLKFDHEEIMNSYLFDRIHCVCFGSLLMRFKVIETIGGMTKEFIGSEDYEIVYRAATKGMKIGNLNEVLYHYRTSETQRSKLIHSSSV